MFFRLLAELVKSYGSCAALITEHVFESGMSDLVKEDTTALAFLLDELLVSKNVDKECSNLIKTLVAALASCNHFPEAQSTLVMEVKGKIIVFKSIEICFFLFVCFNVIAQIYVGSLTKERPIVWDKAHMQEYLLIFYC